MTIISPLKEAQQDIFISLKIYTSNQIKKLIEALARGAVDPTSQGSEFERADFRAQGRPLGQWVEISVYSELITKTEGGKDGRLHYLALHRPGFDYLSCLNSGEGRENGYFRNGSLLFSCHAPA